MRLTAAALAALFMIAGCETVGPLAGGAGGDFASGSPLAAEMGPRERAALAAVFAPAMEEGAPGAPRAWSSGVYSGKVTPKGYLVGDLAPEGPMPVASALALGEIYETEQGLYALKQNANLRAGPSTDAKILGELAAGAAATGVGKVVGKPWMLVATDGKARGYVHENLLLKAPGDELLLAGGPTRRAVFCRAFGQSLVFRGRTDRWEGVACKRGGQWRLEAPREPALSG